MRRLLLPWFAAWIAFGLGACGTVRQSAISKPACAEWQWIGIKSQPEDPCPEIQGWEESPLFEPRAAAATPNPDAYRYKQEVRRATPDPTVVTELKRFCTYEREPGTTSPPASPGKLVRIDRDCAAVAVVADTDPATVTDWEVFSRRFLAQAGGTPLEIKNRKGVRLAFLDTHPTGDLAHATRPESDLASEHGYTLAHIARNLICSPKDPNACAAEIRTRLALPITHFDAKSRERTGFDPANGGRIGLQSDLAEAIRAEVDEWAGKLQEENAPQHLVLNLSVAWDGKRFDGLDETQVAEMGAGTQAVYWALRYAAGFDVLVLAAAGNQSTCEKDRPLLPAAWEQGAPREGLPGLYAVGGVDSMGQPLANARRRAMPPRAAYGRSTVVSDSVGSTTKFTGTSIATAVVSSIAAIVWDTLPDYKPHQIMDLLYRSGDSLPMSRTNPSPRLADFWSGAGTAAAAEPPAVRRISLCPALEAACKELGDRPGCPLQPKYSCAEWTPMQDLPAPPPPLSSCHPWVHTQPPIEPCPICDPPRLSEN